MSTKKRPIEFWHTANCAFSARERRAFNVWHEDLYLAADAVLDALHRLTGLDESPKVVAMYDKLKVLRDMISHIPSLYP